MVAKADRLFFLRFFLWFYKFDVSQRECDQETDRHDQKPEFGVFAHQPADDAVNCRENSAQKNPVGDHFDFGKKGEAGDENQNCGGDGDNRDIAAVGFELFGEISLGAVVFFANVLELLGFFATRLFGVKLYGKLRLLRRRIKSADPESHKKGDEKGEENCVDEFDDHGNIIA